MEPVFTLPYSEYCVAQRLRKLFPATKGYAIYVPPSRQEPGVDLILARRVSRRTRVVTIQVKSSRTYTRRIETERTKRPFRYRTWFNTFECPSQADFVCLVSLYPARDGDERRELGTWWAPQILLFTHAEMRKFLRRVRTVGGKPDRMFGFGFDHAGQAHQTRGDQLRRFRDFSAHLLEKRKGALRAALRR